MAIPDEDLQVQADAAVARADHQAAVEQDVVNTIQTARDSMVKQGDQEGALQAQSILEGLGAPVLDIAMEPNALGQELPPTVAQRGMVTDPNQLTRTRADAQNAATMRGIDGKNKDERAPSIPQQDLYARSGLLDPATVAGRGGGGPVPQARITGAASAQEVIDGLEGLAQERADQYGAALTDTLTSRGMVLEAVESWKAQNADLDPKELYEEVSKRMQENDQKVEQVRQYFVNLSGQSVNPARLYANGGAMTASLAVAVGALSQAMLGPGAPNTALNILESALERDIRSQEMTLNNARQAGQGMLQALSASQEILGDRVQAMQTTKIALREDLLARLEGAVKLSGNATARANLAQVYATAQEAALADKAKLDGKTQEYVTTGSVRQLRSGKLARATQQMAQEMADANATQAPQAAVPTQPAAPGAGISAQDVAGKRAGTKKPSAKPQAASPPAPAAQATGQKSSYRPVEGDTIKDASGNVALNVVKSSAGQLVPAEPLPGAEGFGAVYDKARFNKINTLYNSKDVNDIKYAEDILRLPRLYHNQKAQDTKAIEGIRQWIKDNPGTRGVALTVRVDGVYTDPEAQKLQQYISKLSGPALKRYRSAAQMSDAISEKERPLALGDLASGSNQFIDVEGLRMIADNAEADSSIGLADIEARLHQNGIAVVKKRTEKDVTDEAGKGLLRGAPR
jgi:hypothetical protein